jgi:hypothetical protein
VTELRTEPVFDALKQPLALIESDERRRAIETYIEAARVPLERAVFDLMSQLVQAIDEKTGEQLRIRLAYQTGGLTLEVDEKTGDGDDARWSADSGDVEKITIRVPAELKELATEAASQAGTSANTWFIKALARALRSSETRQEPPVWRDETSRRHSKGSRITGWVGGDED